jgi:hypothetical protein
MQMAEADCGASPSMHQMTLVFKCRTGGLQWSASVGQSMRWVHFLLQRLRA